MSFLTKEDLLDVLTEGVIDAITEGDEDFVDTPISIALSTARRMLFSVDVDLIFALEGDVRNVNYAELLAFLKDIAVWHLIKKCNVDMNLELAKINFDTALKGLKEMAANVPDGWPLIGSGTTTTKDSRFGSNPKTSHYF